MRKTVIYNTGETIRFRCWNRKGYAIFRSLHRHVTIGHVCKSIADSALKKDKSTLDALVGRIGNDVLQKLLSETPKEQPKHKEKSL